MPKTLIIKNKIKKFNKQIQVSGDKSLSIRWVLLASQAIGKSTIFNLITGLIKPDYGKIKIDGVDVVNYPIYLRTTKFKSNCRNRN